VTANGITQIVLYLVILTALAYPLGAYMTRVYTGTLRIPRWLAAPERGFYRLVGTRAEQEQGWKPYAVTALVFMAVFSVLLYALLRLQGHLPLNPDGLASVNPWVAMNTTASFVTNTNWQYYGGEITMSYLSQMAGLAVQNFVSAALGMAVLAAVIRGFARRSASTVGNFWVDLYRSLVYILLPLALILAVLLVSQGVVQTFHGAATATTLEGGQQRIARGPAATQIAIKQLGTNGGGFYNSNSSVPFESPNSVTNLLEMLAILLIPVAQVFMFGRMVGARRQALPVYAAMMAMTIIGIAVALPAEQHGSQVLRDSGVNIAAGDGSSGGNLSDKEVRNGIASTVTWAVATTDASNGSVNGGHDALTPTGGAVPITNMFTGEVIWGGVGSGLYGMFFYIVIAVFVAGLMVGRTPEYLGKKIEAREIKLAAVGALFVPTMVLILTAIAISTDRGLASIFNPGAHGFSETLYAYDSQSNNNGSAFAGYGATELSTTLGGIAMGLGRFVPMLAVLALAGALVRRPVAPFSAGTLRTTTPTFVVMLIFVILLVAALNFIPALALGPVATELSGRPF
jgi:K+-transporting ATPase ATPase A chain